MSTLHPRSSSARSSLATGQAPRGLHGAALSPTTMLLVACGVIGSLLFTSVYLIDGATRPGYSTLQQPISALSLGSGGWAQQVNFVVFGLFSVCAAVGWRLALRPGAGAIAYPLLRAIEAVGLIADGFFSQDPARGYPVGAPTVTPPTTHAIIHSSFAIVTITAIALSCFVLAWRFAHEPRWRGWVIFAIATGLLTMVFIAIFGALNAQPGTLAGLFERLSTGVNTLFGTLVVARLLLDRRRASAAA